jgi:ribosomal protein L29
MKYSEILAMDAHQMKAKIAELVKQLGELQLKKSIAHSALKDTSVFSKMRRAIAKMKFRL